VFDTPMEAKVLVEWRRGRYNTVPAGAGQEVTARAIAAELRAGRQIALNN
jgi:hypothetical protein